MSRTEKYLGSGVVFPLLLLLAWDLSVRFGLLDARLWASPEAVAATAREQLGDGSLLTALGASLRRDALGLLGGSLIGLILGGALGTVRLIDELLSPLLNGLKHIALFTWIPLMSIWLGNGETAKVTFIALAVFLPVMLNTYEGVRSVDPRFLEVARILKLSRLQTLRKVVLPAAAPSIATGLHLALIYGWLATIGAEYLFAVAPGIGSSIMEGREQFRMDLVLLGMAIIGGVGFLLNTAARRLQAHVLRWQDPN
ncbi:MAG: ABC transporter permease [Parvibaculaceae bacterium]|nr:ABC transporter permease [Parvibaculaceae bacterium]